MHHRLPPVGLGVWLRLGSVERLGHMAGGSSCVCCLIRRSLERCLGLAEPLYSVFVSGAVVLTEFWSDRRSLEEY